MTDTEADKLKLMVVDDEPDNLELLYRTFRRDFHVFKACDAMNALEILNREGEMAVIISDQRMPEMKGTEFLSLTVERFPDTIRILLTGFTDVEDLVDAINSGQVFKYITKPWKPDRLKAVVEQAADTYHVVRNRTQELRRALRRESLFNAVTTAIRESLDYQSMLQKIVETIGQGFEASYCFLRPVENDRLTADEYSYSDSNAGNMPEGLVSEPIIAKVIETHHYQSAEHNDEDNPCYQLVVPLIYQQQLLAVLTLCQCKYHRPWRDEEVNLIAGVAEQAALALSQAKLYQRLQENQEKITLELEVARQIQNNLLRQTLPDIKGTRIQACCFPAREVGGDFFEVFVHPKGELWIAVGDVSGKGVPAALFMASAISVLRRELSQETPAMPNVVMRNLNHALCDDLIGSNCFITIVLARYTPSDKELVYANAGHVYPMLWSHQDIASSEEPKYLKTRGIPLGILPVWNAESGQLTLTSGDTLLLASDGITEATVGDQTDLSLQGIDRSMLQQCGLWKLIKKQMQPLSLKDLLSFIQADNDVQEDDQTILALKVL
ncbi:SpoIIE family protein phosphatase [Calothrix sp. PCC 6303]|uniref:SpoIIE family protein phosphatase n=1 Tax=Calothrix sp. PCC 6303 TaxID=1170562 RepID=UPI00031709DC|nr:SpoIIE family protein phosphatase [Calothrix sp. PCC 6303]